MTSPDDLYFTISHGVYGEGPPVFTYQQLADEHGVSRPTVMNYMDEVVEKPGIRSGKIGQAEVFWYAPLSGDDEVDRDVIAERIGSVAFEELLQERSKLLHGRQKLIEDTVAGKETLRSRVGFIFQIHMYMQKGTNWVNWSAISDATDWESSDWFDDPNGEDLAPEGLEPYQNPEQIGLSPTEIDHYLWDAHLFSLPNGKRVVGIGEYVMPYMTRVSNSLRDEHGNIDLTDENLEEIEPMIPEGREAAAGADVFDEFLTKAHNINW